MWNSDAWYPTLVDVRARRIESTGFREICIMIQRKRRFTVAILACLLLPVAIAAAQAPARIAVTGTVTSPDGNLVRDAFVMLKASPGLCGMTDVTGRFRIAGQSPALPATLLVSWAGCKPREIVITEAETQGLAVRLIAQDPEFLKIEVGGAWRISHRGARYRTGLAARRPDRRPPNDDLQECITAYDAFRAGLGEAIMAKLLAGTALTAAEEPYQYLAYAELGLRGVLGKRDPKAKAYADAFATVEKQALLVLNSKGFEGKPFTEGDLIALRRYAAGLAPTGYRHVLPNENIWRKKNLEGDRIRDFRIIPIEQVFASPSYQHFPSLSLTEFVRWEALAPWVRNLGYWDKTKGHFSPRSVEALDKEARAFPYAHTQISKHIGEKPLVVLYVTLEDRAVHDWKLLFKHLANAYAGQANFIYIAAPSPYWGDMHIEEFAYYGPNPAQAPLKGLACRFGELDFTPARLALTVRKGFMERTWLPNVPIFLEYPGYAARSQLTTAFRARLTIIDTDGIVSGFMGSYYDYGMRRAFQTYYMPFDKHDVPLASIAPFEKDLRAVIDNGGKYNPAKCVKWPIATYPKRQLVGTYHKPPFKLVSFDPQTGTVKATLANSTGFSVAKEALGEYTFLVDDTTRVENWNDETYRIEGLDALKPGRMFYPDFWIADIEEPRLTAKKGRFRSPKGHHKLFDIARYKGKRNRTVRVILCDDLDWRPLFSSLKNMMLLSGTIVQKKNGRIAVEMPRPKLIDYPGLKFWDEDKAFAKLDSVHATNDLAARIVPVLRRWTKATTPTIRYTFVVDDAVRIIRDGTQDAEPAKLEAGDRVTVAYGFWWEKKGGSREVIYPELIIASSTREKKDEPQRPENAPGDGRAFYGQ
jgi:hypothetical protein